MESLFKKYETDRQAVVSHKCNLNCAFCAAKSIKTGENIDLPKIKEIFDFLAEGKKSISVIGGEPLIEKKVITFLAQNYNKKIFIPTNGILLSDPFYKELFSSYSNVDFCITLHSNSNPNWEKTYYSIMEQYPDNKFTFNFAMGYNSNYQELINFIFNKNPWCFTFITEPVIYNRQKAFKKYLSIVLKTDSFRTTFNTFDALFDVQKKDCTVPQGYEEPFFIDQHKNIYQFISYYKPNEFETADFFKIGTQLDLNIDSLIKKNQILEDTYNKKKCSCLCRPCVWTKKFKLPTFCLGQKFEIAMQIFQILYKKYPLKIDFFDIICNELDQPEDKEINTKEKLINFLEEKWILYSK